MSEENAFERLILSPESTEPAARRFVEAFRRRYGRAPDASNALGYDGGKVLADALARASELTPPAIRSALAATRDFSGATGRIRIDEHRNAVKPAAIIRIDERGEFHFWRKQGLQ